MISFAWPWVFFLIPLPLFIYLFFPAAKKKSASGVWVPFFSRLEKHENTAKIKTRNNSLDILLLSIIWLALLAATARPETIHKNIELPAEARDLMLAVDISGSMDEKDMNLKGRSMSRIDALKILLGDFIQQRKGDRIGLIVFGEKAYLHAPLTFDLKTIDTYLKETQLGFAGRSTAIGDAIGLSIKRLQKRPSKQRILILLTDGSNTAGSIKPIEAAKLAAQANVKIYTIGIGSDGRNNTASGGLFGQIFGNLNAGRELDEETLKAIASITGAQYFRAKNTKDLIDIYTLLNQLEPIEQDKEQLQIKRALLHWPLMLALLLSIFVFLQKTNFLRQAHSSPRAADIKGANYE